VSSTTHLTGPDPEMKPITDTTPAASAARPVTVAQVPVREPDLPVLARALTAWRGWMEWNQALLHATGAERALAAAEIAALDRVAAALPQTAALVHAASPDGPATAQEGAR
jgi:hypothetical protein